MKLKDVFPNHPFRQNKKLTVQKLMSVDPKSLSKTQKKDLINMAHASNFNMKVTSGQVVLGQNRMGIYQ